MSAEKDGYKTTTATTFIKPTPKPFSRKPSAPPLFTPKSPEIYMKRPVENVCHCDMHLYDPKVNQYKELAKKETILCHEMEELDKKMSRLGNEILEHPCDTDDMKMKSLYQIDYSKRGKPIMDYSPIMAAVDAPGKSPIAELKTEIGEGYRDPTSFRYTALQRPRVDPCRPLTLVTIPHTVEEWFMQRTGRTEFQDTISKNGLSIMRNQQQYREPMPSSRRRAGDLSF